MGLYLWLLACIPMAMRLRLTQGGPATGRRPAMTRDEDRAQAVTDAR